MSEQKKDRLSHATYFDLSDFLHRDLFLETQRVWEPLKKLKDYFKTLTLGKIEVDIPKGAFLINPSEISIGEGSVVDPGAYIEGPCVIGKNCHIRHGAYVRPYLLTGDNCVIGHTTEAKHSILLNGAKASHFSYIGDSILGNRVNLGAGVKCANFRLDKAGVVIRVFGERFETGLQKLGLIMGDHSSLGCNCVTNPGTILGKGVSSFPCITLKGVIDARSVVRS